MTNFIVCTQQCASVQEPSSQSRAVFHLIHEVFTQTFSMCHGGTAEG